LSVRIQHTLNFQVKTIWLNPKLFDQVRDKLRVKQYAICTEQFMFAGLDVIFTSMTRPTQNQAKSALLFLYREVLEIKLPWLDNASHRGG